MKQDLTSWNVGYRDGRYGIPYNETGLDKWSYTSGYIEGKAARLRFAFT